FTQLVLEPLTDEEAARIVEATFDWLPDELRDRIVARAGGNPFFIEESLRSLVESGAVQKDDGGEWRLRDRPSTLEVPATLHAVVQEVAYNTLLVRRRALLHRGVAVAYEKVLNENELREFYPALAHHYLLGDVPDKAVEYSWKAAQRATAIHAYVEALRFAEQSLEIWESLKRIDQAVEALYLTARIRRFRGENDGALAAYERARQLVETRDANAPEVAT